MCFALTDTSDGPDLNVCAHVHRRPEGKGRGSAAAHLVLIPDLRRLHAEREAGLALFLLAAAAANAAT